MNGVMIRGAVDRLDSEGAIGWLYGSDYTAPPIVRAFLHHDMIGESVANGYRPDLEQVGFGDGRCGFEIRFNRPIDPTYLPFVTVKPNDVDLHLPIPSSGSAYVDLINAVLVGYSGSGRSRSVLGGLWTDRVDAPQLLAGRVAVGACAAELQPALQELIHNGYMVLHNALAPNGVSSKDITNFRAATSAYAADDEARLRSALTGIAGLLFRESVVRLLRAAFDDHPAVYRLDMLAGTGSFAQASSFEDLPSPGECVALYVGNPDGAVRIDYVRDSHEMPEFGPDGRSRWTGAGAEELSRFALEAGLSIESLELDAQDIAIVGPGLVHRVVAEHDAPALRAVAAPRRVTPTRFLSGDGSWSEVGHVSGARIRV
jgi:hypothetical protein